MRHYLDPCERNLEVHGALGPLDYAITCFRAKMLKAEKKATTVSVIKGGNDEYRTYLWNQMRSLPESDISVLQR